MASRAALLVARFTPSRAVRAADPPPKWEETDRVVWKQAGAPRERSRHLQIPRLEEKGDAQVVARRHGQVIEVTAAAKVTQLPIRSDDRTANLDKDVRVTRSGTASLAGRCRTGTGCW